MENDIDRASTTVAYTDILDLIEKNEKMNEVGLDKHLDASMQLLSFDKKFYQVKKKFFDYNTYPEIVRRL